MRRSAAHLLLKKKNSFLEQKKRTIHLLQNRTILFALDMSKNKKKIDEKQISLFTYLEPETPPSPGSMDVSMRLRHAVSNAIKKSDKDRIESCLMVFT